MTLREETLLWIVGFLVITVFVVLQFLARQWWKARREARALPAATCKDSGHRWRTIAEPYARQCRKCGAVEFREDGHGGFPDGLDDYFGYVARLTPEERRLPSLPNQCHCGASMTFKAECYVCHGPMILADDNRTGRVEVWYCRACDRVADDTEKPIWFCEVCHSWKIAALKVT